MAAAAGFAAGRLTPHSPVIQLKYIGPYLSGRLNAVGLNSLSDVVQYFDGDTTEQVRSKLTRTLQNRRGNEPVPSAWTTPQAQQFAATKVPRAPLGSLYFHVADVNRMGFNAILDLLRFARAHPEAFPDIEYQLTDRLPRTHDGRTLAAKHCGGQRTQASCNKFTICDWRENREAGVEACVPADAKEVGFPGVAAYKGQHNVGAERRKPAGPRRVYVSDWVKAGKVPRYALPVAFAAPAPAPAAPPAAVPGWALGLGLGEAAPEIEPEFELEPEEQYIEGKRGERRYRTASDQEHEEEEQKEEEEQVAAGRRRHRAPFYIFVNRARQRRRQAAAAIGS